jgi:hypothetical protein
VKGRILPMEAPLDRTSDMRLSEDTNSNIDYTNDGVQRLTNLS